MLSLLSLSSICCVAGIYLYDFFENWYIIIAMIVIANILSIIFLKDYKKYILTANLFLIIGMASSCIAQNPKLNNLYELNNKYVTVTGYVADLPEQNSDLYSYKIKTTKISCLDKNYKAGQVIKVTSEESLTFGDTVCVQGFLKEFSDKKNHSDFNVKRYYQSRGIFFRIYAYELEHIENDTFRFSPAYLTNLLKSKYADAIDKEFSGDRSAVLKAIALGNKKQFSEDFEALMLNTGVIKFFYPAFLHISLISLFVAVIFRFTKKSHRDWILAGLLILYAISNCHSPIVLKSTLVVISGIVSLKRLRFTHRPDILALTVLVICFINPLYCFDVGFVMSVSATIILYYWVDIAESWFLFIPFRRLRKFLTFHIVLTVGLLPITAYYFNGIAIFSTLLSPVYLFATCSLIILMPVICIMSSVFGSAFFLKIIADRLLWIYMELPEITSNLPFSHIWLKSPDFIFIAAFFGTFYIVYQAYLKELTKTKNIFTLCVCAGLWVTVATNYILSMGDMNITFVNVGQGDGAVVDIVGGETLLIDGGGKSGASQYDAGKQIFAPYLADNGHFNIDMAFVSHYHSDHCLGIIAAMESFNVKEVVMPDCDKENEYRKIIERIAKEKNIKITHVLKGDTIKLKSGAEINVLSPSKTKLYKADENEASLVMELKYKDFSCLFTGDIGANTEKVLLHSISDCDVVKMAHHGSENSNSKRFAEAVNAEFAVVSLGENNSYGFPHEEAVYNYQQSGAKVIRTDINGDVFININKNGKYKIFCYK